MPTFQMSRKWQRHNTVTWPTQPSTLVPWRLSWPPPTCSTVWDGTCHHSKHIQLLSLTPASKVSPAVCQSLTMRSSPCSSSSDESGEERSDRGQKRGRDTAEQDDRDFGAFLQHFPVTATGHPPTKKQRTDAGFPPDRVFYDRWRAVQYGKREEYLLCKLKYFIMQ